MILFVILLPSALCASIFDDAVDLSYDTSEGLKVTHPLHTPYKMTIKLRGEVGDLYVENNDLEQGEHAGTHIDAPAHFARGNYRMHQIPLRQFAGPAVVIDITERAL